MTISATWRHRRRALLIALLVGGLVTAGVGFAVHHRASSTATPTPVRLPGVSASASAAGGPRGSGERTAYVAGVLDLMDQGFFADGPDWERAKADALAKADAAATPEEAYAVLDGALAVAGGHHSRLFRPGQGLDTGVPEVMPTVADDGCVPTLVVPALGSKDPEVNRRYALSLADAIDARRDTTCGFVVDVRGNTGGNAWPMVAGLAALLPDGPMLDFVHRDGSATHVRIDGPQARVGSDDMISVDTGAKVRAPVAVLADGATASSAEVVVLAFRGMASARSFGAPTAGFSSSNDLFPLPDGATLMLTTGLDRDRAGVTWGGAIPPEVVTAGADPVATARAWLDSVRP
jgi:hypothetical protein